MKEFRYTALKEDNSRVEGVRKAKTRDHLMQFLVSNNLTPITIREKVGIDWKKMFSSDIGGIPLTEKVLISKQLSTMISAGIPIIQAIGILSNQATKPNIKNKLEDVYKRLESGNSLSKAFRSVGGFFSEIQLNLIAAGEKSGNLNEMLHKVAEDMDKSKKLKGKIQGALIYPVIIFFVLVAIVAIMVVFMVPQITELYNSLDPDAELPFITLLLVKLADVLRNPVTIIGIILLIIGVIASYRVYVSKPERRLVVDGLKLKIPVFGNLMVKIQLAEFCRLTSMLVKSGISIIDAVGIVSNALSNSVYSSILINAQQDITKGNALSVAIAKNNRNTAFPPILVKIISTGEESGKMDFVLEDMYKFYDDEVEQVTSNLTKLLEPFILVVVGGLVALLAIAIYLPIYNIGNLV